MFFATSGCRYYIRVSFCLYYLSSSWHSCRVLYLNPDAGQEPASLLGHEVGIHTAAVVACVEEVVDVKADGNGT